MNLQPINPNTHTKGWLVVCCECNQAKDTSEAFADLDRVWVFVCHDCAKEVRHDTIGN